MVDTSCINSNAGALLETLAQGLQYATLSHLGGHQNQLMHVCVLFRLV